MVAADAANPDHLVGSRARGHVDPARDVTAGDVSRPASRTARRWRSASSPLVFNFQVALGVERQPDRGFEQGLALWVAHSQPGDLLIENGRLTAHLLFWSDRPHAMNVYRVLQAGARTGDPLGAVRRTIDAAIADRQQVLFAGGLDPYFFTDDILHLVGVTRASLADCFDRYRREGPMFAYQEWPASPPTPVYRLQPPDGPR